MCRLIDHLSELLHCAFCAHRHGEEFLSVGIPSNLEELLIICRNSHQYGIHQRGGNMCFFTGIRIIAHVRPSLGTGTGPNLGVLGVTPPAMYFLYLILALIISLAFGMHIKIE